jgi:hypothetical protein
MPTYVQAQGRDTWHWCQNCSNYPSRPAKSRTTRPRGDLCNQCKAKQAAGNCKDLIPNYRTGGLCARAFRSRSWRVGCRNPVPRRSAGFAGGSSLRTLRDHVEAELAGVAIQVTA